MTPNARLAVTAVVAVATLMAPSADARMKRVCELVKDPTGDATAAYAAPEGSAPNAPALDVLSADFATAGPSFGVVVRVDDIPDLPVDPQSPTGHQWFVLFSVAERTFFVDARSSAAGDSIYLYEQEPFPSSGQPLGALDGVVDRTRDEVRIWGPLSLLGSAEDVKKGTQVLGLEALSGRFAGVTAGGSRDTPSFTVHADFTAPGRTYRIGTPSCVTVGR